MKVLIGYLSYSGNTEEIAELIANELHKNNIKFDMVDIGYDDLPDLGDYEHVFLGTFTWDEGALPDEFHSFIENTNHKVPKNTYIFGSGETQFGGDELFCKATNRLADFYKSKVLPLKIEQSPRGSQEKKVTKWFYDNIFDKLC